MYYFQLNYPHFETGLITDSNKQFRLFFPLRPVSAADLHTVLCLCSKAGSASHSAIAALCCMVYISYTKCVSIKGRQRQATKTIIKNKYIRKIADKPLLQ